MNFYIKKNICFNKIRDIIEDYKMKNANKNINIYEVDNIDSIIKEIRIMLTLILLIAFALFIGIILFCIHI